MRRAGGVGTGDRVIESLITAVRSGNARLVNALLSAGADPDSVDEHGTPALCLAVDAFDLPTIEVLIFFAGLDRASPDGRTPLLRAIELGDPVIVERLIVHGARLSAMDAEGRDALALARYWHEKDVAAEVRRRSGRPGPVERTTIRNWSESTCGELSLGHIRVRTGHTAILTGLEPRYGIVPSFDELLSRAMAEPDVDHEVWWATIYALQQRHDAAVWDAAAALRDRSNPLERYFAAEVLRMIVLLDESDEAPFGGPLVDLFLPWVAGEPDPRVVRSITAGLTDSADPRAEVVLPELTRHADGKVRARAVSGLYQAIETGDPAVLDTVMERTRDEEPEVRRAACFVLAAAPAHDRKASDSLASCLADTDEVVRVQAAARLALRDDPRGDDILRGLDATDEDSPYHWLLYEVSRHRHGY
ncbi:ankyrin repeat domain-containing protein [Streptomyces sp. NRRL S-237]|uniref:ankyrin repeat domain-containing protein n=1 Tax=Streptomyces sp. NRRL S-237 TaxID=1463895 RepID=UPI00099C6D0C|nr:ankyrin repeat domain-containing protein [Streptomyces sp. NRRL S-237]